MSIKLVTLSISEEHNGFMHIVEAETEMVSKDRFIVQVFYGRAKPDNKMPILVLANSEEYDRPPTRKMVDKLATAEMERLKIKEI